MLLGTKGLKVEAENAYARAHNVIL